MAEYKVKAPNRWKHNGKRYMPGDEFLVDEKYISSFPKHCIIEKVEDELEKLDENELYKIMQDLDINPRTRIREKGRKAMIESIKKVKNND